jgi:hypothetical protein
MSNKEYRMREITSGKNKNRRGIILIRAGRNGG